jgi:hypothetical protein
VTECCLLLAKKNRGKLTSQGGNTHTKRTKQSWPVRSTIHWVMVLQLASSCNSPLRKKHRHMMFALCASVHPNIDFFFSSATCILITRTEQLINLSNRIIKRTISLINWPPLSVAKVRSMWPDPSLQQQPFAGDVTAEHAMRFVSS